MSAVSWATDEATRRSMQGNRRRDTAPEIAVRRILHSWGMRYRVDYSLPFDRRRKADIAFTRVRVAVFIDGCFWHGCPEHYVAPKSNDRYWYDKVHGNQTRDADTTARLADAGWLVVRFWEHESPLEVAQAVRAAVAGRTCD